MLVFSYSLGVLRFVFSFFSEAASMVALIVVCCLGMDESSRVATKQYAFFSHQYLKGGDSSKSWEWKSIIISSSLSYASHKIAKATPKQPIRAFGQEWPAFLLAPQAHLVVLGPDEGSLSMR